MLVLYHWKSFSSPQILLQKCKGIILWAEAVFSWKERLFKKFRKVSIRCRERRSLKVFAVCISIPVCCWRSLPWICAWDQMCVAVTCDCSFTEILFSKVLAKNKNKIIFSLFSLEFNSSLCFCETAKGFSLQSWTVQESLAVNSSVWFYTQTWSLLWPRSEKFGYLFFLNMKKSFDMRVDTVASVLTAFLKNQITDLLLYPIIFPFWMCLSWLTYPLSFQQDSAVSLVKPDARYWRSKEQN